MALAFDHVFITVSSGRGKPSYRDATIPMGGTSHVHFSHVAGTRDIAAGAATASGSSRRASPTDRRHDI